MSEYFKNLRDDIEKIDSEIIEKIKDRLEIAKKIGEIKKKENLEVLDEGREKELLEFYSFKAEELGLNVEMVHKIFKTIMEESKDLQNL